MLNWFRSSNKPATSQVAVQDKPRSAVLEAEDAPASEQAKTPELRTHGMKRVSPVEQHEVLLAETYRELAKDCRKKFTEPGFDLPTLPGSAMRVLDLIQDPNISARKVAQTLQTDPVITAKFLRMANSPMYAGAKKVNTIEVALQRLGLATVRSVVLAISMNSTIIRENRLGANGRELWKHSIHTGMAAQALAARLRLNEASAFTLGLMHDIGKLPAWLLLSTIIKPRQEFRRDMLETLVEDAHAIVGEALIEAWAMPLELKLVVGGHHIATTLDEAKAFVKARNPDAGEADCEALGKLMGCVILGDKALAALGLAQEPGELVIADSGFATDLGLSQKDVMDYLGSLPALLDENNMTDI